MYHHSGGLSPPGEQVWYVGKEVGVPVGGAVELRVQPCRGARQVSVVAADGAYGGSSWRRRWCRGRDGGGERHDDFVGTAVQPSVRAKVGCLVEPGVAVSVDVGTQKVHMHALIEIQTQEVVGFDQVDGAWKAELPPPGRQALSPLRPRGALGWQVGGGQVPPCR